VRTGHLRTVYGGNGDNQVLNVLFHRFTVLHLCRPIDSLNRRRCAANRVVLRKHG
jgi:hypothetical protein